MEDKYYTPDISEFYVGFECEFESAYQQSDTDFEYYITTKEWLKYILERYDQFEKYGQLRVKYLDKEDIESLGFKYIKTHAGLNEDYFEHIDKNHYCDYDYDSKYLRIAINGNGDVTRFSGIIENKSELKKLLKQLNIC
jgi:hypothetical protein